MAQIDVLNEAQIDFVGTFRDKPINIPAGKSIKMGRAEAIQFLGEYSPIAVDGRGRHKMPKMLKIVEDPETKAQRYNQPLKYKSFDGTMFRTTTGLQNHEKLLQTQSKDLENEKPTKRRTAPTPTI